MSAVQLVVKNEADMAVAKEVEALENRLKELKKKTKSVKFEKVEFKHRKTGETQVGINIHGITAKPMFVYGSQALKLIEVSEALREFVEANRSALSWK
jgi:hypothetical protein